VNDEEQRDDNANCHPDFDAPDDRQCESEEHERDVDPCSHPAARYRIKRAHRWSG
jgi:hypothetical protein